MSSNPTPTPPSQAPRQPYAYTPPPSNGMGVAGFVVSLCGLFFTAGFICPIGLVVSLFGLRKEPRGLAIGGVAVGLVGSLLAVFVAVVTYRAINSSGGFWSGLFAGPSQTQWQMDFASDEIDEYFDLNNDTLPDEATGNSLIVGYLDEWNNPLRYRLIPDATEDYELISAGADGQFDTADDIVMPYTAFGFGSHFGGPADVFEEDEANDVQINYSFNQAAERINLMSPPGSPKPDEAHGGELIKDLVDPWNTPLRYGPADSSSSMFHIKSAGPDGQWRSGDDIARSFFYDPAGNE